MYKLCRSLAGGSIAFALTGLLAAGAAAQESPAPDPQPQPEPPAEAEAQQPVLQAPVVIELAAVEGAEGSGEATLRPGLGDQTEAVLEVEGLPPGTQWSAFLVAGTCDQPGEVIAPLGTVDVADAGSGRGEAAVTTALADLATGPVTVQVHPEGETPTQALLCGAAAAGGPSLPVF